MEAKNDKSKDCFFDKFQHFGSKLKSPNQKTCMLNTCFQFMLNIKLKFLKSVEICFASVCNKNCIFFKSISTILSLEYVSLKERKVSWL